MLLRNILWPTLILPTITASLALLITWRLPKELSARGAGATATALAFLSGFVALTGLPRWPPIEATQRVFVIVALAGIVAWFLNPEHRRSVAWWVAVAILTALLLVSTLQTPLEHTWSIAGAALWLGALFVVGVLVHWSWAESLATEGEPDNWTAAVVRIAMGCGLAVLLGLSGSARLGQLAGALTCGIGVVEVGSRVLGRKPWHGGAGLVLASASIGLLIPGYFYAALLPLPGALAVLSCLMLGMPMGGKHEKKWMRALALVPLAIAVGLAVIGVMSAPEDPYADYYSEFVLPARPSLVKGPPPRDGLHFDVSEWIEVPGGQ